MYLNLPQNIMTRSSLGVGNLAGTMQGLGTSQASFKGLIILTKASWSELQLAEPIFVS
jgi:hypothetical protein